MIVPFTIIALTFVIGTQSQANVQGCVCGMVTGVSGTNQISGWVYDDYDRSVSVNVEIDMDGPHGTGHVIALFPTNLNNSDVLNMQGNHAFVWKIPSQYTSQLHMWYVYGISEQAGNYILLQNAPAVAPLVTLDEMAPPEVVFDYNSQACEPSDIPDHPARAFRTKDGLVSLVATHWNARRNIGTSLNNVVHNCDVMWASKLITNFYGFRYYQWPETPYTLDGQNIYMIFHNEWYGSTVDAQCNGDSVDSWVSAMVMGVSFTKGKLFHMVDNYKVRTPVTAWNNTFPCSSAQPTRYGSVGGSNIIYSNGYYYKYFIYEPEPIPYVGQSQSWECIMRSADITNPHGWQVWTNPGWLQSQNAPCAQISSASNIRYVAFDTYLNIYIAVEDFGASGFFFIISQDLMNWSAPMLISAPKLVKKDSCYPSILDPNDQTLNFENPGESPYLYYSESCTGGPTSLKRIPLKFFVKFTSAQVTSR